MVAETMYPKLFLLPTTEFTPAWPNFKKRTNFQISEYLQEHLLIYLVIASVSTRVDYGAFLEGTSEAIVKISPYDFFAYDADPVSNNTSSSIRIYLTAVTLKALKHFTEKVTRELCSKYSFIRY